MCVRDRESLRAKGRSTLKNLCTVSLVGSKRFTHGGFIGVHCVHFNRAGQRSLTLLDKCLDLFFHPGHQFVVFAILTIFAMMIFASLIGFVRVTILGWEFNRTSASFLVAAFLL